MVVVALITTAYTSYGGLPASLKTDRIQAWMILGLVVALLLILFGADIGQLISDAKAYNPEGYDASWSYGSITYMDTFASGLAIVIAVTAAEMFSQGNWQRTWASEDDKSLKRGALIASALVLPLVFIMGFLGTVVAGRGSVDDPSLAFFTLIGDNVLILSALIILVLALVCSSIDTLQNAIVASITRDISDGKMEIKHARIATIAIIPLAIYLATGPTIGSFTFDAWSVFGIFLIADLLAAATVAPVLLTLWRKVSSKGALLGAFAGIISVIIYGMIDPPSGYEGFQQYFMYLIHPTNDAIPTSLGGMTNLWVFLSAILGSTIVTIIGSYALPDEIKSAVIEEE
jgi:Na+/proline symporter